MKESSLMDQPIEQPFDNQPGMKSGYVMAVPWYQKHQRRLRQITRYTFTYALLLLGAFIFIVPFLGMLSVALKAREEIFAFPPRLMPDSLHWENFIEAWTGYLPFTRYLLNSLKISINAVIGNLFSCALPAYAFARLRARGKNILFAMVLATMVLPTEVTVVPQYLLFTNLGWNNTHWPLMVPPWLGWPFFIFLLRQFFLTIPKDLDDAARIDGASSWQILWYIILPLSKPALAAVTIFSFIGNWNNFLTPLIYLRDQDLFTLSVGLLQFQGSFGLVQYHYMMAVAVLMLIPVLIVFLLGQRLFVQGVAMTGLKG
jgi:multiple sugar transport system permease protein